MFSIHKGVYQSALDTNSAHMCGCTVNYWKKPRDVVALCCVWVLLLVEIKCVSEGEQHEACKKVVPCRHA